MVVNLYARILKKNWYVENRFKWCLGSFNEYLGSSDEVEVRIDQFVRWKFEMGYDLYPVLNSRKRKYADLKFNVTERNHSSINEGNKKILFSRNQGSFLRIWIWVR